VSAAISFPTSAGESARAVAPRSASRAFILGSASPALISFVELLDDVGGRILGRGQALAYAYSRYNEDEARQAKVPTGTRRGGSLRSGRLSDRTETLRCRS
jgi:hypothetical protein